MFNAATIARVSRAHLAALAFVILSASLAEATYGPRTTIGNSYQQFSNTWSSDGINQGSCHGFSSCYVLFQLPPRQKALIVQHVSCRAQISTGIVQYGFLQTRKEQIRPARLTHLMPVPTTGGWAIVNSPVMHLVESGERPLVRYVNNTAANWSVVACAISGTLQP